MKKVLLYIGVVFCSIMLAVGVFLTFSPNYSEKSGITDIILVIIFAVIDTICIILLDKDRRTIKNSYNNSFQQNQQNTSNSDNLQCTFNKQPTYPQSATPKTVNTTPIRQPISQQAQSALNIKKSTSNIKFNVASTIHGENTVYSQFVPNYNKSIDEISSAAIEHSEAMYKQHQKAFMGFDPFHLDVSIVDDKPLTSVEISFLKYMNENDVVNPYIPGYWTYEYNINYKKILTTFLVKGYLEISSDIETLPFLTVNELKDILRNNGLKVSGKKSELIDRIKNSLDISEIKKYIFDSNKKYLLTEKGLQITSTVKDSATKNTDLEDSCLKDILNYRFNDAYIKICFNELQKNIPRGFVDWNKEQKRGLSKLTINYYTEILQSDNIPFPDEIDIIDKNSIKACLILSVMLGIGTDKTYLLICRITEKTYNKAIIIPFLQKFEFNLMQQTPIDNYKNILLHMEKKTLKYVAPIIVSDSTQATKLTVTDYAYYDVKIKSKEPCDRFILSSTEATFIATLSKNLKNANLSPKNFLLEERYNTFVAYYSSKNGDVWVGRISAKSIVSPDKYAVIKQGNQKASRIFEFETDAKKYIEDKQNYYIELRKGFVHPFSIQYMIDMNTPEYLETNDIQDCINAISEWIKYIQLCTKIDREFNLA